MAPKKHATNTLSKSAKYYRDHPEARAKKAKTDTKINQRPAQRKKRAELSTKRRQLKKKGVNLAGKDLAHGKNGSLRLQSSSKNRGDNKATSGDRKARGKKK